MESVGNFAKEGLDIFETGVAIFDAELRLIYANPAFRAMRNYPDDVLTPGVTLDAMLRFNAERGDFGPGDPTDLVADRMAEIGKTGNRKIEREMADGQILEIRYRRMPSGGLVVTFDDRTAERRAERSESRFASALATLNDGVLLTDADGRLQQWNERYFEIFQQAAGGVDISTIIYRGRPFLDMVRGCYEIGMFKPHPGGADGWVADRARSRAEATVRNEFELANGTWLRFSERAMQDGGRVTVYTDVTDLKRAEQVSRDSEARLREILERSPIGVAVIGNDNLVRFHNPRFPEILRGPGRNLVGTSTRHYWEGFEERAETMEIFARDGHATDREERYRGDDGSEVWALASYERIEWEGEPARLVWIYDITEAKANREALVVARDEAEAALAKLRRAQEQLVQAEKMASLGQLTAGIAHEIKNPLNFVNNFSQLSNELLEELAEILEAPIKALDAETRDDAEDLLATVRENLDKINEHGRRADSIVKNMLAHSREGPSERQAAHVSAIVEEALNLAYHGARAEDPDLNIQITRDLDAGIGPIDGFPQDLMRVFLNLIGNAIYAAGKFEGEADDGRKAEIAVSSRAIDGAVEIDVRDNGAGIAPEMREKIFLPFFTTKPAGEGTGLGLSLSYDIVVKQHGGELTVDSEPGKFTVFRVRLPAGSV